MKKIIIILSIFMLLSTVSASVFASTLYNQEECNISALDTDNPETLDQYQNDTAGFPLIVGRFPSQDINLSALMAQSFVPTKEILTKVDLYLCKNYSTSHPFVVNIRKELDGENLVTSSVSPQNINTLNVSDPELNFSWVSFNIESTFLDVGETYYIVGHTENTTDNWYLWAQNNDSSSYLSGEAYLSYEGASNWTNHSREKARPRVRSLSDNNNQSDMCFKTYGIDSTQFEIGFERFGKNLTTIFNNTGSVNATSVFFEVNITGGILGGINVQTDGLYIDPITPSEEQTVQTPVFGFGRVNINASIYANNAKLVSKNVEGFVFLKYIFVLPTFS